MERWRSLVLGLGGVVAAAGCGDGGKSDGGTGGDIPGLVAYWSFNSQSDPGHDDSGLGNDQVNRGATWASSGKRGGAMSFDGAASYMESMNQVTIDTSQERTVSAWVRLNSTAQGRGLLDIYETKKSAACLYNHADALSDAGVFCFYNGGGGDGADTACTKPGTMQLASWYHLVGVVAGSSLTLYVNKSSADVQVDDNGGNLTTVTNRIVLGRHPWLGGLSYLDGLLDEVRIYNRALTQSEVDKLYDL